jgi:hypothetical protein
MQTEPHQDESVLPAPLLEMPMEYPWLFTPEKAEDIQDPTRQINL